MAKRSRVNAKFIKSSQGILKKRVFYSEAVFGTEEKNAVISSLNNKWLASGPLVKQFEIRVARLFGKKYGIAVNSGSSANLIALQSLHLEKGSEVITPACTFSTTVSSIVNCGLSPVFVDSVIGRYTVNENEVEGAIGPKTKAIMVPHLIGGVCNMPYLRSLAKKYSLILVEDSCDTFAPTINGKPTSFYSDITTASFYGSHIITTMGMGGMVLTNSLEIQKKSVMLKDWGRIGDDNEDFQKRFNFSIDGIPFDSKFLYEEFGYNFKMTEASAAFGLVQLKRFKKFRKKRENAFGAMYSFFKAYEKWFYLPSLLEKARTSWLAFPLTVRKEAPFSRYEFLKHMEENGIQTRVLFSGNITRHPAYRNGRFRVVGTLKNSDQIMASSLLLGCHQSLTEKDIDYVTKTAKNFLAKR